MTENFTNAEITTLILSTVVAISTIVYTILTWRLVFESKRMRDIQMTPDINFYFEFNETDASLLYLVIENNGLGSAQNVHIDVVKNFDFYESELQNIENFGAVKNGLQHFYSRQKYKYYFTDLSQNSVNKIDKEIIIKVSYQNVNKKQYSKEFTLPIKETMGLGKLTPPDTHIGRIAYYLEKLNKNIESLKEKPKV